MILHYTFYLSRLVCQVSQTKNLRVILDSFLLVTLYNQPPISIFIPETSKLHAQQFPTLTAVPPTVPAAILSCLDSSLDEPLC